MGQVDLHPVLAGDNERMTSGAPVTVTVERPEPVELLPAGILGMMPEGLVLTVQDAKSFADRAEGEWLEKAGVGDGSPVAVEGWFETTEPALAQFQFRGNLPIDSGVTVDGVAFAVPAGTGWRSFPVALKVGTHSLVVKTTGRAHPRLDIRYGVRGTAVLNGKTFRHR
jgi:hypothetical protein